MTDPDDDQTPLPPGVDPWEVPNETWWQRNRTVLTVGGTMAAIFLAGALLGLG